jgi:hypothetical protein
MYTLSMCQDFSALDTDSIRNEPAMVITATTVWLLLLTTPGGVMSLQSIHQTPAACEAAREKYKPSRYYTVRCDAKETLR